MSRGREKGNISFAEKKQFFLVRGTENIGKNGVPAGEKCPIRVRSPLFYVVIKHAVIV